MPYRRAISLLGVLLLALLLGADVRAQQPAARSITPTAKTSFTPTGADAFVTRTLRIVHGAVYIDGARVDDENLPQHLRLEGVDLQLWLTGYDDPVVQLDGARYRVEADRLVALDAPTKHAASDTAPLLPAWPDSLIDQMAQRVHAGGTAPLEMAEEPPAPLASDLPRLEVERYLAEVHQRDLELYLRLRREMELEQATFRIARELRRLPADSPERSALVERLRELLQESFELKQENRRQEVRYLERELERLRHDLEERQHYRDALIERRLRELTMGRY